MFAARDGDGRLWLYNTEPIWQERNKVFRPAKEDYETDDYSRVGDDNILPEILPGTFREVELIIKKN